MRTRIYLAFVAALFSIGTAHAAEKEETPDKFYIIEYMDCFQPPQLSVGSSKDLAKFQKEASGRNRAIPLAFKKASKEWSDMEKERVDKAREEARKKKQKGGIFKKPFLLKEPKFISIKADGPYSDLDTAVQKAEEREKAIAKRVDFAAKSEERKIAQMAEQVKKSYEEQQALIEKQKEMFLAALNSLAGKSSLLASGGNVKRLDGRITRLVKNTRRMGKPSASSATATKVDQRAVQNK